MKIQLRPIHDQVTVLVGATSGIGLETAKLFAERGARVAIVGRSQEGLDEAVARVRSHAENHRMLRTGSMYGSDMYTRPPGSFATGTTMPGEPQMGSMSPGTPTSTPPGSTFSSDIGGGTPSGGTPSGGMGTSPMGGTPAGGSTPSSSPISGTSGFGTAVSESPSGTSTMENQVIGLEGDITSFEQMRTVAEQVIQRFGRIDTWVNVAGIGEWALFEDTSPDEFRRIIEVNLIGHANGAMAALPYLRQQHGGSLIFVSSIAGRVPVPYQAAYSASKHGLNGMIDTLRMELKHTGAPVSVTNILPTSMNTPLFEKARTKLGVEPDPIPPIYDNTMVAKAILHASSHPVRELIVGDAGIVMNFMNRLSPRLTTKFLAMTGFRAQRSDEFKSAMAPDNMYEHLSGYNRSQGDYMKEMRVAPMTWLSTHPQARTAIFGVILAALAGLVGWRIYKRAQYRRTWRYRLPRQLRSYAKQFGKSARHASKSTGKALHHTGQRITHMPVVSELPMFHRPSLWERIGETLAGFWAGALAILPFTRRKKLTRRISDRLSDVKLPHVSMPKNVHLPEVRAPWKRQKTFVERVTLADQRKVAGEKLGKSAKLVRAQLAERRKDAAKAFEKTARNGKDLAGKSPTIERRESFVERVSFKK